MKSIPPAQRWTMVGCLGLAIGLAGGGFARATDNGGGPARRNTPVVRTPPGDLVQDLRSDALRVKVYYSQPNWAIPDEEKQPANLHYVLSYGDRVAQFSTFTMVRSDGDVMLADLNGDRSPEVIVKRHTGGNTCCTQIIVHSWQGSRFTKAVSDPFYNGGDGYGEFVDLDKNGIKELNLLDERFFHRFGDLMDAHPPKRMFQVRGDEFRDVTRSYPTLLRKEAQTLEQELRNRKDPFLPHNTLAGYVARKALIGEFDDAWAFMLQRYNPQDRTGLEIYPGNTQGGEYADFPTALKAFLKETGYI